MEDTVARREIERPIVEWEPLGVTRDHARIESGARQMGLRELDVAWREVDPGDARARGRVPRHVDPLSASDVEDLPPRCATVSQRLVEPRRVSGPRLEQP